MVLTSQFLQDAFDLFLGNYNVDPTTASPDRAVEKPPHTYLVKWLKEIGDVKLCVWLINVEKQIPIAIVLCVMMINFTILVPPRKFTTLMISDPSTQASQFLLTT